MGSKRVAKLSVLIEAGVHLYSVTRCRSGIWVYLPLERTLTGRNWRCDMLVIFPSGEVSGRSDIVLSESYLSSMSHDLDV